MQIVVVKGKAVGSHPNEVDVRGKYPAGVDILQAPEEWYRRNARKIADGTAIDPRLEVQGWTSGDSTVFRENLLGALKSECYAYIVSRYDIGVQMSMAGKLADSRTPTPARASVEQVIDWVDSVMEYYYTTKLTIIEITDQAVLASFTWDYYQFDATDPLISMESIHNANKNGR
jgi:hypothetical protein